MEEIEIERSYLAKSLPENLASFPYKEIFDVYFQEDIPRVALRARKKDDSYEITRKYSVSKETTSSQIEETIKITEGGFKGISASPLGKKIRKLRYLYDVHGKTAEIDVFQDALSGLVLVEVEFKSEEEMNTFSMPEFCLADVTEEPWVEGGHLAGKSYQDIEEELKRFNYTPLNL
jgi:CYTH domain-containing protein